MTEVQAYNANPTATTAKCGPIAEWDVSAITNMKQLFYNLKNFNQDISSWDTSSVTTMYQMFKVRSSPCPAPNLQSSLPLHAACTAVARPLHPQPGSRALFPCMPLALPPCTPHTPSRLPARTSRLIVYALFSTRQYASTFNQPLSFDTSSVTDMSYMFYVRSSPGPGPQSAVEPTPARCL